MSLKLKQCVNGSCKNLMYVPDFKLHMLLQCEECIAVQSDGIDSIKDLQTKAFAMACYDAKDLDILHHGLWFNGPDEAAMNKWGITAKQLRVLITTY